jgi:hypothetical protein
VADDLKPLVYDAALGHEREMVPGEDTIDPDLITGGAGLGDVVGPASSVDNTVPRYDSTTGKLLQTSGVAIDDSNNVSGVANLTLTGTADGRDLSVDGAKLDTLDAARQIPAGGTGGQVLKKVDGTDYNVEWDDDLTGGGGGGDVVGPGAATDNRVVRWDGATGTAVQDSAVTIDDSGNATGLGNVTMTGNLTVSGTVDGRDVSADGTAQDTHIAAAAPHAGHLTGPASVADNRLARFDGTTGKIVQESVIDVDDLGNVDGVKNLTMSGDLVLESGEITAPGGIDIAGSVEVGATLTTGALIVESTSTLGGNVSVTGNISVSGTVDGRDVSTDGTAQDAHIAAANPHSGHAIGAASSTDNAIARFDGAGGKTIQNSGVTVSDANNVAGVVDLTITGDMTVAGTVDGRDVSADGEHVATSGPYIDEEAKWPEIKFQCSGEWTAGMDTSAFPETVAYVQRVSTTNATWTASARTLTKTNAFATYDFEAGDTWQPSTTDGGWVVAEYAIESKTDASNIVLAAGPSFPADNSVSDGSAGRSADTTNNRLPWDGHRFVDGEAIQFTGAGRPQVGAPYGPAGGAGAITNLAEFFVKQHDPDTIEVYGSRALDVGTKVDFTTIGTSWSIRRRTFHYREENFGGWEIYNTIGAPPETTDGDANWTADPKYSDQGFDVFPAELSMGGGLRGEITGILKQRAAETRNLYFVLDLDPDVRAHGVTGCNLFKATCVAATKVWTKTAHGLKTYDIVQAETDNGGDGTTSSPVASGTNFLVRRIDADTFYLCDTSDTSLKTIITPGADGQACIVKTANGNWNRIKFSFAVPNTVSTVATHTITNASWDDGTLTLTAAGQFANYLFEDGDQYEPSTTDGSWTVGDRFTIASRTSDNAIVLLDNGSNPVPTTHAGVADGIVYSALYTPFRLTWWFERDAGEMSIASASKCGIWYARLEIGPNGYMVDPATPSDGYVARQTFHRTTPRTAVTYNEQRQQEWGPLSRARYYSTGTRPTFTYAVDEPISGGTSGATGVVIRHDNNAETILYRPDSIDLDFMAGETITGASGSLVLGPIEGGPIPIRICTRVATSGAQDDRFEVRVHSYRVTLSRNRLG